jgi:hypothetical protein
VQAILRHPIVVGFGARQAPRLSRDEPLSTSFGWIVALQMNASGPARQIDGQYDLGAVISVPSWWRSVSVKVETCWIARSNLGDLNPDVDSEIYRQSMAFPPITTIRLPGGAQEVSRKLGIEILQEPYLLDDGTLQTLEIGKRGSLLLMGGRLWRSTEVTLGAQQADHIVVLPNMEGIIATFECVEPQNVDPDPNGRLRTKVRVWTSEGVADTQAVSLLLPRNLVSPPLSQVEVVQSPQNAEKTTVKPGTAPQQKPRETPNNPPLTIGTPLTEQQSADAADKADTGKAQSHLLQ